MSGCDEHLVIEDETFVVFIDEDVVELVIYDGAIPGPAGTPGEGPTFDGIAAGTIHGDRVVKMVAGLVAEVDQQDRDDMLLAVGISQGSAMIGEPVTIRISGERTEPSWNWSPGILFAGADGVLTQVQPTTGWSMEVARTVSATRIIVGMTPGIWRGN